MDRLIAYFSDEKNQNFLLRLLRELRLGVTDYREQDLVRDSMSRYETTDVVRTHIETRDRESVRPPLTSRPVRELGSRRQA